MCDLHKDTPCLLDRFSREFMDEQDIQSDVGIALLQLIMSASHADTALIECWHAWSRRVATRLGTQAKRPTQHDMFARHVAQRLKRRSARCEVWRPSGDPSADAPDASADTDKAEHGTPKQRKRKSSGGGGAWRAHVSKMLKGGEQDFHRISSCFRDRTEGEVAADAEAGRAATERHRAGIPSFGPTRRQEEEARISNAAVVFNRLHNKGEPASLSDADSVASPTLSECNAANFTFLMKVVRKADFLLASEKKRLVQQLELRCQEFSSTGGHEICQQCVEDIPTLAGIRKDLMAMPPDRDQLRFDRVKFVPDTPSVSANAVAMDSAEGHVRSKNRNLGVGLDAYWNARMSPINPEDWDGPEDKPVRESRCFLAGHCLCSDAGRKLSAFRDKFIEVQKLLTARDTPERDLLANGFLVWVLRGEPRESLVEGMAMGDDASSGDIDESTYVIWHMPFVLFSPYVPVFHALNCNKIDDGDKIVPGEELAVEVHIRTTD